MGEVIHLRKEMTFGDFQDMDVEQDGGVAGEFFTVPRGWPFVIEGKIYIVDGKIYVVHGNIYVVDGLPPGLE